MICKLEKWNVSVRKRKLRMTEAVAKADVQRKVKILERKIHTALGGKAAEHSARRLNYFLSIDHAVFSVGRMAFRITAIRYDY